jgi:hypothetical protein
MAKKELYKQCTLRREQERLGIYTTVAWIPSSLAILGKNVQLKENEQWGHVWTVTSVSTKEMDKTEFKTVEQLIKGHREATGDATKRSSIDGSLSR